MLAENKKIHVDPRALEIGVILYLKKIQEFCATESERLGDEAVEQTAKSSSSILPENFAKVADSSAEQLQNVRMVSMATVVPVMSAIACGDDIIKTYNKVLAEIMNEQIHTWQPESYLRPILELTAKTLVFKNAESSEEWYEHTQIVKEELADIVTAMTTAAPTTLTNAAIKGADVKQLNQILDLVKEVQSELVLECDTLRFPSYGAVLDADHQRGAALEGQDFENGEYEPETDIAYGEW